jgi:PBSX family phage terminase large subunit
MKIENLQLIDYQVDFLRSAQKIVALIGGTGCGKTFLLPIALLYKALEYYQQEDKPMEIIVLAPTHKMLLRNPLKYIESTFVEYGIDYQLNKSEMTIRFTYATVYLISAESYDSMQGIHAQLIIMDEAGLMGKPVLDTALQRLAFHGGQLLILSTPYGSNHWLKTEVYDAWLNKEPNVFVVNPRSYDNPFYPESEIERARKMLPEWKFRMFFEAEFTRPAGLIFEEVHYIAPFKLPSGLIYFRGLDFGFNNPNAIVQLALDPNNNEVIYLIGEWKRSQTNIDDLDLVLKQGKGPIYADPAGKDALETLRRRGHPIHEAKKNVLAGISMLDALFRRKKLLVFDNLPLIRDELSSYAWQVDRHEQLTDKPTKENDHLIDALRYATFTYEGGYLAAKYLDEMFAINRYLEDEWQVGYW